MRFTSAARALIAGALFAASGCGLTSSPAGDLRFKPPEGWRPSPSILGFMQYWRSPANDGEVLMLFRSPKPLRPEDFFSDQRLRTTVQNVSVERRENIVICDRQPATRVEARGSSSGNREAQLEMVATNAAGNTYFAMYVRPVAVAPNAMAEAALVELCPKS
jgi:hypothetical protein